MASRRGVTLLECLIAMTIFSVFVGAVAEIFLLSSRSLKRSESKLFVRRRLTIALDQLRRELHCREQFATKELSYPFDSSKSIDWTPTVTDPIRVNFYRAGKTNPDDLCRVRYYHDPTTQSLHRVMADQDREVCHGLAQFEIHFDRQEEKAEFQVTCAPNHEKISYLMHTGKHGVVGF